jgi:hypothetical protein
VNVELLHHLVSWGHLSRVLPVHLTAWKEKSHSMPSGGRVDIRELSRMLGEASVHLVGFLAEDAGTEQPDRIQHDPEGRGHYFDHDLELRSVTVWIVRDVVDDL